MPKPLPPEREHSRENPSLPEYSLADGWKVLTDWLAERITANERPLILIGGASAAGKTTMAGHLGRTVPELISVISLDEHYRTQGDWHDPDSIDFEAITRKVRTARAQGQPVIVEGMFALKSPLLEVADLRVFVDADESTQLARRLSRNAERGAPADAVLAYTRRTVWPAYRKHILPTRQVADFVIRTDQP